MMTNLVSMGSLNFLTCFEKEIHLYSIHKYGFSHCLLLLHEHLQIDIGQLASMKSSYLNFLISSGLIKLSPKHHIHHKPKSTSKLKFNNKLKLKHYTFQQFFPFFLEFVFHHFSLKFKSYNIIITKFQSHPFKTAIQILLGKLIIVLNPLLIVNQVPKLMNYKNNVCRQRTEVYLNLSPKEKES